MKKLVLGLSGVFLCLIIISSASALVWDGSGHDYQVIFLPGASWEEARLNISDQKYLLATITSQAEQNFIMTELIPSYNSTVKRDLWIGGLQNPRNEPNEFNGWSWITGEAWGDYSNWAPGEPNDYYDNLGISDSEQFLSIRGGIGWKWNDEGNFNNISGYIMETAPVPEPGTILLMGFGLLGLAAVGRKKFL
jgi:hypothetical protein